MNKEKEDQVVIKVDSSFLGVTTITKYLTKDEVKRLLLLIVAFNKNEEVDLVWDHKKMEDWLK